MARYSEAMEFLGERIRSVVGDDPRVTEKMMFGGLTFLLNGRILIGCREDGAVLLSVGRENHDAALARPGASAMSSRGRTMTGFIWVEGDAIEDDDDLAEWVQFAWQAVIQKPPKPPAKPRKPRAAKAVEG